MALALQVHEVLGVLGSRVVDSTLGLLLALPTTGTLILVLLDGLSRVVVTNALVPAVEQFVVWHVVLLDILLDLVKGPVGQGVDLDETSLIDFNDVEVATLAALATAATSEDGMDVQFPVGTLGRFNLGNPVVELVVCLPEAGAVLLGKFLFRVNVGRLVYVDVVHRVGLADAVDKGECLFEVVQSVEEDKIHDLGTWHIQLGEHVKGHETSQTESSGLEEMRKRCNAPSQNIYNHVSQWIPLPMPGGKSHADLEARGTAIVC